MTRKPFESGDRDATYAGDEPQAIEKLVKGIEKGYHDQLLLGVTGPGKTYTMANVIALVPSVRLLSWHITKRLAGAALR